MKITFNISDKRAPALVAAVLTLHPKPTNKDDPRYVASETDKQWVHRVLQQRFRRTLVAILKKAERESLADPDPGMANERL